MYLFRRSSLTSADWYPCCVQPDYKFIDRHYIRQHVQNFLWCGDVTKRNRAGNGVGVMGFIALAELRNGLPWGCKSRRVGGDDADPTLYNKVCCLCTRNWDITQKTHLGNSPSAVKHFLYSTLAKWCATCFVPSHHLKLFKFHCHLSQQGENFNSKLLCSADDLFNCKTMFNPSTCVSSM